MTIKNDEITCEIISEAENTVKKLSLEAQIQQMVFRAPAIPELGIRAYTWWNEALHGVARAGTATVFPQAIGLAATFDEGLLKRIGDAVSTEGRAKYNLQYKYGDTDAYKGLTFWAPNVNIFRDPRWGRGHETYGEDPFLTSKLAVSYIKGLQGEDERYLKAAACAKHFVAHSGPESERHHFNAVVSKRDLYETYLPAFKACVCEGSVESVMGAYNRTNGEPCCGTDLIKEILRDKWGFKGHFVSDCWAVQDIHLHHGYTSTAAESAALAVRKGCDLNCGEAFYSLTRAVSDGLITEKEISDALTRVYATRIKLGNLFESDTSPYDDIPYSVVDSDEMKALNLEAAKESLVLLHNDGILPLDISKYRKIGVVGPNADNRRALVGNYEGTASRYVTPLEGIEDYVQGRARVMYSKACHLFEDKLEGISGEKNDRISELSGIIEECDVIIAVMGLDSGLEGEEGDAGNAYASGDKKDLLLPGNQNEVLKKLAGCGKPVIVIYESGSALTLPESLGKYNAFIQAFYPGAQGGRALAEMLFGDFSPSGKLPVTFYNKIEDLPDFSDYRMKGRTYRYFDKDVFFPFGYGLTYTKMTLASENKELSLSVKDLEEKNKHIECAVSNIGETDSGEVVQLYIHPVMPKDGELPIYSLKGFERVFVPAGGGEAVKFTLVPEMFSFADEDGEMKIRDGQYEVCLGFKGPYECELRIPVLVHA